MLLLLLLLLLLACALRSCTPVGQVGLRSTTLAACAMRLLRAAARAGSHAACLYLLLLVSSVRLALGMRSLRRLCGSWLLPSAGALACCWAGLLPPELSSVGVPGADTAVLSVAAVLLLLLLPVLGWSAEAAGAKLGAVFEGAGQE